MSLVPGLNFTSGTNATMRGVVYNGVPYEMVVDDVPVPIIQNATDAIVKITTSALCGSDLHTYHGFAGAGTPPWVMGHEAMGYIAAVGSEVSSLSVGDYVVIADTPHWGHLASEPQRLAFFGGGAGGLGGLQSGCQKVVSVFTVYPLTTLLCLQVNTLEFPSPTIASSLYL